MKKIPVWKNVVLIIATIVVIVIATLAWFVMGNTGRVQDLLFDVSQASFIKISSDNGETWSDELNVEFGINKNFREISGDGINFFAPLYDVVEKPNGSFVPEIIGYEVVDDNNSYYDQIFTFQSDTDQDIYLSPESFAAPATGQESSYIQGAVRVAFFELDENNNEILKCIWAPNSKIEYSKDTDSFNSNGNVESNYYYQKTVTPVDVSTLTNQSTNPDVAIISTADADNPTENLDCGYDETHKFMWSNGNNLPENAPSLLRMVVDESDNLATKKMKVRVWLEGYDRECVSQLNGKKFTMKFQFITGKGE